MEYIALMGFSPRVINEAKEFVGADYIENINAQVEVKENGKVAGMPNHKRGTTYIVSSTIFNALGKSRLDVGCFDWRRTEKNEEGFITGQGGFIFKKDL